MRIPSTTELVTALKSKDKEQIKEAKLKLKKEGDKYFASVPFPDVERMVAKEMLKTYANYIPAEQRINIFEIINSRFKEVLTPSLMPVSNIPFSAILKTLRSLSRNQVCIK